MFEDLELNVTEPKSSVNLLPTHNITCWETTKRICSETSVKLCC